MSTLSQLSYNKRLYKRIAKKPYSDTAKLYKNPQLKGVLTKLAIMTPKKPNSAIRHVAKVNMYKTKKKLIGRLPGIGLLPNKYNRVLVEGGRANDLPTVRYTVIRGAFDFAGLYGRKKRRSIYGARRVDGTVSHVRRRFRRLGYA